MWSESKDSRLQAEVRWLGGTRGGLTSVCFSLHQPFAVKSMLISLYLVEPWQSERRAPWWPHCNTTQWVWVWDAILRPSCWGVASDIVAKTNVCQSGACEGTFQRKSAFHVTVSSLQDAEIELRDEKILLFWGVRLGYVWKILGQSLCIFLNTTHAENVADPSLRNEEEITLLGSVVRKHGHFCFFIDSKWNYLHILSGIM